MQASSQDFGFIDDEIGWTGNDANGSNLPDLKYTDGLVDDEDMMMGDEAGSTPDEQPANIPVVKPSETPPLLAILTTEAPVTSLDVEGSGEVHPNNIHGDTTGYPGRNTFELNIGF